MFSFLPFHARWGKSVRRLRGKKSKRAHTNRPSLECLEDRFVPSAIMVTNTNDSGPGSLRKAITQANSHPGSTIDFDLDVNNSILPVSQLPAITSSVEIDGASNPITHSVAIDGSLANAINLGNSFNGLTIDASGCTILGLTIVDWLADGIAVNSSGNLIQGNQIGTYESFVDRNNGNGNGIVVHGAGNTIGGVTATDANLISANRGIGIIISGSGSITNQILGNHIGVDAKGNAGVGNGGDGVAIEDGAQDNFIGGQEPGDLNVISGNGSNGVSITTRSDNNSVLDNNIGTRADGTQAIANRGDGIFISSGASNNQIGFAQEVGEGESVAVGNLISGNAGNGVEIAEARTENNDLIDNQIGTDVGGTKAIPNDLNGVLIESGASNNTVGSAVQRAGNTISGNKADGVEITDSGTTGNTLEGNQIGTTVVGDKSLSNRLNGVDIENFATANWVGVVGVGNVISGNAEDGVLLGANHNYVQGNLIGVNADDSKKLGNHADGVGIVASAENEIGGAELGDANVISGNSVNGISITEGSTDNGVLGNFIGTNLSGAKAIGNKNDGVFLSSAANSNFIGNQLFSGAYVGNVISGNNLSGVEISGDGTQGNPPGMGTQDNVVLANKIGTDSTGTVAIPNQLNGVLIDNGAVDNSVGTGASGASNLLSGNASDGIALTGVGTTGNNVLGNKIGTDITGELPLPNIVNGVAFTGGASGNTVGGPTAGARNLISGNPDHGVLISGAATTNNQVEGNWIGANVDGTSRLGNGDGVDITGMAQSNTIGGVQASDGNVISGNLGDGIEPIAQADSEMH